MSLPALLQQHRQPLFPLRVATWNLQSCRRGLPAIAAQLSRLDADLVALQEVDCGTARSGGIDQAAILGAAAGFPHVHFFAACRWGQGHYGLALLARMPLRTPRTRALPVPPGAEPRILASARLDLPGGELEVHVTHLSHRPHQSWLRARQSLTILEAMGDGPGPNLLLGDFNDLPRSAMHRTLSTQLIDVFGAVGLGAAGTRPLAPLLPALRIDYVFASRALQLTRAQVVRTRASDHFALVAELAVGAAASGARRAARGSGG